EYERRLQANQALDFDDLIMRTVQLWEQVPEVLEFYQNKFLYVHVDEYQDTNHAQYRLIALLTRRWRNLCVVGDSDQAIYGWRGADIRNILEFERDFPDAQVIRLEQNYRSTKTILTIANEVIRHNSERPDKTLWTANAEGEPARLYVAWDERDEAHYIVEQMRLMHASGRPWQEMAVLFRTHAQSRVLEEALLQQGIPYQVYGGVRFYERKEIRDLLAYLRLLANPADELSFRRIVNVPRRGVGEGTLEKLQVYAAAHGVTLPAAARQAVAAGVSGKALQGLRELTATLDVLTQMRPFLSVTELTEELLQRTGYRQALLQERTLEAEARVENLDEFLSVTREFDARWRAGMSAAGVTPAADSAVVADDALVQFLGEVALLSDLDTA
ncbi:MAG: UvrD-helicase domain-containing protein, partial [Alicyclobacillus sp.]|nr:UvrD-helicase domain-containing protein [Alicyclobacillus sp.]